MIYSVRIREGKADSSERINETDNVYSRPCDEHNTVNAEDIYSRGSTIGRDFRRARVGLIRRTPRRAAGRRNISIAKSNIDKCAKWRRVSAAGPPVCTHTYGRTRAARVHAGSAPPARRTHAHAYAYVCTYTRPKTRRARCAPGGGPCK